MSGRIQSFVVSFVIGLLLVGVFSGGLVLSPALLVAVAAMILWIARVAERSGEALILPIVGLIVGILAAVLLAPLAVGEAATLWLLLLVLFS